MSGQSKSSTARIVAVGWLEMSWRARCQACNRPNRNVRDCEVHWEDGEDNWVSSITMCGGCAALCIHLMEDGAGAEEIFGVRYPFVT